MPPLKEVEVTIAAPFLQHSGKEVLCFWKRETSRAPSGKGSDPRGKGFHPSSY